MVQLNKQRVRTSISDMWTKNNVDNRRWYENLVSFHITNTKGLILERDKCYNSLVVKMDIDR